MAASHLVETFSFTLNICHGTNPAQFGKPVNTNVSHDSLCKSKISTIAGMSPAKRQVLFNDQYENSYARIIICYECTEVFKEAL